MKPSKSLFGTALGLALGASLIGGAAFAQEVTLRVHQFLPEQATIPANAIAPWAERIEAESDGRIEVELYPSMQLGGAPPTLYDQARDGVVDVVWTVLGYTPGRFPKAEVFELPFIGKSGEATSRAFHDWAMENAAEEFDGVHVLALHTHGPGLIHANKAVETPADLAGMKVRGPSRVITNMLEVLGATPVGMPVPQVPESLSKGVIDGAVIPWEVTGALKTSELVDNHTEFSGENGLYTVGFAFVMNEDTYEGLPDDLRAVIDANSGVELAAMFGRAMDEGDVGGRKIAEDRGNTIIVVDEAGTEAWREAAQPVIDDWIAEATAAGLDGQALYDSAVAAIAAQ